MAIEKRKDLVERLEKLAQKKMAEYKSEMVTYEGFTQQDDAIKVSLKCSTSGKLYVISMKETNGRYRSEKTEKISDQNSSSNSSVLSKQIFIDLKNLEPNENTKCPYCGNDAWIKCDCGGLSCAGGVTVYQGKSRFKCNWCHCNGILEGRFWTITGESRQKTGNRYDTGQRNRQIEKSSFAPKRSENALPDSRIRKRD